MKPIFRYRCYVCAEPHSTEVEELQKTIRNIGANNTIVALCDGCEKRFKEEGVFWRRGNDKEAEEES